MDDANSTMSWIEPFGSELVDNMNGTESFPALLVMDENIFFPKQKDDYNCGIATVATTGTM